MYWRASSYNVDVFVVFLALGVRRVVGRDWVSCG